MTNDEKAADMVDAFRPLADLNRRPSTGPEFADESEHFIICGACGQAIDCRRLGDVCHHEMPDHERLPVS